MILFSPFVCHFCNDGAKILQFGASWFNKFFLFFVKNETSGKFPAM